MGRHKAQRNFRQRDAQNYGWRLLWKADGLQPQQRPASQTHQLINDCYSPSQGLSNPDAHTRGRYGFERSTQGKRRRRRRTRGPTLHSHHVGITVWTTKRLEETTWKNWSHAGPVWRQWDATMEDMRRQWLLQGSCSTRMLLSLCLQLNQCWGCMEKTHSYLFFNIFFVNVFYIYDFAKIQQRLSTNPVVTKNVCHTQFNKFNKKAHIESAVSDITVLKNP